MNKKASLKDAFVRNMEGAGNQQTSDTATQPSSALHHSSSGSYTSNQEAVHTASHLSSGAAAQPAIDMAPPSSQRPASLYTQQSSYPPPIPIKKKATFNLDAALHQRLKIAAAMHSREMVDIVQDALQAYLPVLDKKVG